MLNSQYGIRFKDDAEADLFVRNLAKETASRLKKIDMCGRSLALKVMVRDPDAPVEAPKVCVYNPFHFDTFNPIRSISVTECVKHSIKQGR